MTRFLVAGLTWTRKHPFLAAAVAVAFWLGGALIIDATVDDLGTQTSTMVGGLLGLPLTGVVVVAVLGHLEDARWQPVLAARRTRALRALDPLASRVAGLLGAAEPQATMQAADRQMVLDGAGKSRPITRTDAPLSLAPEGAQHLGSVASIVAARSHLIQQIHAAGGEPDAVQAQPVVRVAKELRMRLAEFMVRARDAGFLPQGPAPESVDLDLRERELRALPAAMDMQTDADTAVTELLALMEQCRDGDEVQVLDALLHSARNAADDVARTVSAAEYLEAWLTPPLPPANDDRFLIVVSYYFKRFPDSAASLSVILRVT